MLLSEKTKWHSLFYAICSSNWADRQERLIDKVLIDKGEDEQRTDRQGGMPPCLCEHIRMKTTYVL